MELFHKNLVDIIGEYHDKELFVAKFVHGREKYDYKCEILGVFTNEKEACLALFNHLVDEECIYAEVDYNGCDCNEADCEDCESQKNQREEDITQGYESISRIEDLENICENDGDSYFGDGWTIQIDKCQVKKSYVGKIEENQYKYS